MKFSKLLILAAFLSGCESPRPGPALYSPSASPSLLPSGGRTFKVRVTLSRVSDLLVHSGDKVEEGSVLVDRSTLRKRLNAHLASLKDGRTHLGNQMALTDRALRELREFGSELPAKSFESEKSAIRKAEIAAESAIKKRKLQEQFVKVEQLIGLSADQIKLVQNHEKLRLEELRSTELAAIQNINSDRARLVDQQESYQFEIRKHKSDFLRQELVYFSQREQTYVSLAHLNSQILDTQLRLDLTTEVKAPFAGIIKRIDWEEMSDERIIAVIYLADALK